MVPICMKKEKVILRRIRNIILGITCFRNPMKKMCLLLLLLCASPVLMNAQMDKLRMGLTLQPFTLVEFNQGGNLRLGLQTRIAPRLFLHGEFGKYLDVLSFRVQDLQGYNWRAALQYNYSAFYYVSLDYFYKDHSYALEEEISINGILSDQVQHLQKYSNAITIKWGRFSWMKKRKKFFTDWYMGAGLRLRHVRQSGLTSEEIQNLVRKNNWIYKPARKEGSIFSPEFSFGLRIGWAVFKKE